MADKVLSQPWLPTEADEDSNSSEAQQSTSEPQGVEQEQNEDQPTAISFSDYVKGLRRRLSYPILSFSSLRLRDYVKL